MKDGKKKENTNQWLIEKVNIRPDTWESCTRSHFEKALGDIKSGGPINKVEKICLKYWIAPPRVFVSYMDLKFIDRETGEYGNLPDPKEKLGIRLGSINSSDERIIYLEAIIEQCKRERFHEPFNEQFEQLQEIAEDELDRIGKLSKNKNDTQNSLSKKIKERIKSFARYNTNDAEGAETALREFEIMRLENRLIRFSSSNKINFKQTARSIIRDTSLTKEKKKSIKRWTRKYSDRYWESDK